MNPCFQPEANGKDHKLKKEINKNKQIHLRVLMIRKLLFQKMQYFLQQP